VAAGRQRHVDRGREGAAPHELAAGRAGTLHRVGRHVELPAPDLRRRRRWPDQGELVDAVAVEVYARELEDAGAAIEGGVRRVCAEHHVRRGARGTPHEGAEASGRGIPVVENDELEALVVGPPGHRDLDAGGVSAEPARRDVQRAVRADVAPRVRARDHRTQPVAPGGEPQHGALRGRRRAVARPDHDDLDAPVADLLGEDRLLAPVAVEIRRHALGLEAPAELGGLLAQRRRLEQARGSVDPEVVDLASRVPGRRGPDRHRIRDRHHLRRLAEGAHAGEGALADGLRVGDERRDPPAGDQESEEERADGRCHDNLAGIETFPTTLRATRNAHHAPNGLHRSVADHPRG
jgi:hypothetical protein